MKVQNITEYMISITLKEGLTEYIMPLVPLLKLSLTFNTD